jgi:YD repeat-containing protein
VEIRLCHWRAFGTDAANRLVEVIGRGNTIRYVYDSDGNLRSRTVNGVETHYVLDLAASLAQVLVKEKGGVATTYLYGVGRVAYREGTADWNYCLADRLGSGRGVVNSDWELARVMCYAPFGAHLESPVKSGFGFAREQHDFDTGLILLRARYLSPATGRFLTEDSLR